MEECIVVLDDIIFKNNKNIDYIEKENEMGQIIPGRDKWNKEMNKVVMECYFRSQKADENGIPLRRYSKK